MKSLLALFAAGAVAAPLATRQMTDIDVTVLQFALTLEHLENVFYHNALQKFSLADFEAAGYSATYYNNLKYISFDEQSHVQLLTTALTAAGAQPVAACEYNFAYTDVASFVTLSSVLEGVGTSAYLGGAPLITSKDYLTVAGSILVTEALHTSMQRGAIGEVPMANPYGTPLDPTSVYTLAAAFIKVCPANNVPLPFKPFPALTYAPNPACTCEGPDCANYGSHKRGEGWYSWSSSTTTTTTTTTAPEPYYTWGYAPSPTVTVTVTEKGQGYPYTVTASGWPYTVTATAPGATVTVYEQGKSVGFMGNAPVKNSCSPPMAGASITLTAASTVPSGSYVTFVSGLTVTSVAAKCSGSSVTVAIPAGISGQTYVFITSADVETSLDTSKVLFGPAIVEAPPAIDYSVY